MKTTHIFHLALGLIFLSILACSPVMEPQLARAQDRDYAEPYSDYSHEELAQMLAPIALYPDALLSQILMASTYPIEVVEADRWVKRYPMLKDEALDDALLEQDWAPSVKAICHFPSILALMSEKIGETTKLGNAFLSQEAEVMDMVQDLRAKAYAQGNLGTNANQKVIVERETIIIEPASPRVIYVPYYDPYRVYGPWWYPSYPPSYWGPSGVSISYGISYWPGFYFSFTFGSWSYFDWHRHYIHIEPSRRPRYVRHDYWGERPGPWRHAPVHRRGVVYRDRHTAERYDQTYPRTREIQSDTLGWPADRRQSSPTRNDDLDRVIRERTEQQRQEKARIETQRLQRERAERDRAAQEQAEQQQQEKAHSEGQRLQREQIEQEKKTREQVLHERQNRNKAEQEQGSRGNAEGEPQLNRGRTLNREGNDRSRRSDQSEEVREEQNRR